MPEATSTPIAAQPSDIQLDWEGQFAAPSMEEAHQLSQWPVRRRSIQRISRLLLVFFAIASVNEWLSVDEPGTLLVLSIARALPLVPFGFLALALRKNHSGAVDSPLLAFLLTINASYLCVILAKGGEFTFQTLNVAVLVIAYYLFIPLRLRHACMASLSLTLGYLLLSAASGMASPQQLVLTSLILAVLNVGAARALRRRHVLHRQAYAEARDRAAANEQLKAQLERHRASEHMFRALTENTSNMTTILNGDGQVSYSSPSVLRHLGVTDESEERKNNPTLVVHPDDRDKVRRWVNEAINQQGSTIRITDVRLRHGTQDWRYIEGYVTSMLNVPGVEGIVINYHDVSELKDAHAQMSRLAFYDSLTGLANRQLFKDRLQRTIEQCKRRGTQGALLFLDLDNFKTVNDTLGHEAGDRLLREVARRLLTCVRTEDSVARLGGDEFTVVLQDVDSSAAVGRIAQQLIRVLGEPIPLASRSINVGVSIGIAMIPGDADELSTLMRYADLAMYSAKAHQSAHFCFFSAELNVEAQRRMQLIDELKNAVRGGEFYLEFQPQIDLTTYRVVGLEALARWNHPERGLIPPVEFIDGLEESGLIVPMGHWVIHNAIRQGKALIEQGYADLTMAVNLSARQLIDPELLAQITLALTQHGFPPRQLELEITEHVLMEDFAAAVSVLQRLKTLGVRLTIDDFGTGYSSLNYLKQLPVQRLKVDKSFIRNIPDDSKDMAITAAVIAMAHKLDLEVVAEGVETLRQLRFLEDNRADQAQGFLFSRSVPVPELAQLLTKRGRADWTRPVQTGATKVSHTEARSGAAADSTAPQESHN